MIEINQMKTVVTFHDVSQRKIQVPIDPVLVVGARVDEVIGEAGHRGKPWPVCGLK